MVVAPLAGTDDALWPFWSPDSRSVGFFTPSTLKKIDLNSRGVTVVATELSVLRDDERRRVEPRRHDHFWSLGEFDFSRGRERRPGGTRDGLDMGEPSRLAAFLPDGRRFLYHAIGGDAGRGAVYAASLDSSAVTRILDADTNALFVVPDSLLVHESRRIAPTTVRRRSTCDTRRRHCRRAEGRATVRFGRVCRLQHGCPVISNAGLLDEPVGLDRIEHHVVRLPN